MKDKKQIKIKVKELPELHVAYVRHTSPYKGDAQLFAGQFGKLMEWVGPGGCCAFQRQWSYPYTMTLRRRLRFRV